MKKIIIAGIIVLVVLIAIPFYVKITRAPTISEIQPSQAQKLLRVSQAITSQPGTAKFDTIHVAKGKTALDALKQTNKVEMDGTGANAFITGINGIKPNPDKKEFWAYYVNDKQAEVGAGSYILKEGDKIEWKLETYK